MSWFYINDGEQIGPLNDGQLSAAVRNGTVRAETRVWQSGAGMREWLPCEQVLPAIFSKKPQPPALPLFPLQPAAKIPPRDLQEEARRMTERAWKPLPSQKPQEDPRADATFWQRAWAWVLDGIVLQVLTLPLTLVYSTKAAALMKGAPYLTEDALRLRSFYLLLMGLFFVGYYVLLIGSHGATLGKMALDLKVVDEAGGKIGFTRAFSRLLSTLWSVAIFGLGCLEVLWGEQRRAWHDNLCGTRVVRREE